MSLTATLEAATRRYADRVAVVDDNGEYTYGELEDRAQRLAGGLKQLGVEKGDRVQITLGNALDYFTVEYAVAKLGAVKVPTLTRCSTTELRKFIEVADVKVVFAGGAGVAPVRAAVAEVGRSVPVIVVGDDPGPGSGELALDSVIAETEPIPFSADVSASDLYAIRFTGGTVEIPKGVVLAQRAWERFATAAIVNWDLRSDDRFLHIHPVTHASGFLAYGYWLKGAVNVMSADFAVTAERVLQAIERHGVTSMFVVPTFLSVLLDSDALAEADVSTLRTIFYGGAPITPSRLRQALEVFGPVFAQTYGSSETAFSLTTLLPEEHEFSEDVPPDRLRSVGRISIASGDVRIRAEDGSYCEAGRVGAVVARGDVTMLGYWKNDELTAERMQDGWVLTDDIGYFDEEGYLYLADKRRNDMIITGGFNVWPKEVEAVLEAHPAVREAAVYGVPDDHWGQMVCAVVVGEGVDVDELRLHARGSLVTYKVPKRIAVSDRPLPRYQDGTLIRAELVEAHVSGNGGSA